MNVFCLWLGALCTLAISSFLYRENRVYRFFEHLFMGISFGYGIVLTWTNFLEPRWWQPMTEGFRGRNAGMLWLLAPVVGSMYYFIFSKKRQWIARTLIGLFIGVGAGMAFRGLFAVMIPQVVSSFKPVWVTVRSATGDFAIFASLAASFNNIAFVLTLLLVMLYFSFGFRHDRAGMRQATAAGRIMLMISFGATFGATVMGRMSLLIDRVDFLYHRWFFEGVVEPVRNLFS